MILSVIVPTRNRAGLLNKFLQSITTQTLNYSNYEVIIIDNGSTDNTYSLVEQFTQLIPNLRYIYESNPGLHSGRHRGFLECKGNILVYADDDIEAFPTWLETISQCFDDINVMIVGGKNLPNFESSPPHWLQLMWNPNPSGNQILVYLSILDLGNQPKLISPYFIFGCNFAIRRHILEDAGGFHPDGMPQDLIKYRGDGESYVCHYVESKGYKALYDPNASVYHWVSNSRMTVEYFCRRAYNQGISDSYTQIRKTHELSLETDYTKDYSQQKLSKIINRLKYLYSCTRDKCLFQIAKIFLKKLQNQQSTTVNSDSVNAEFNKIKAEINEAYQSGFAFHQQEVQKDPYLLTWVLRRDYWDYRLPLNYQR